MKKKNNTTNNRRNKRHNYVEKSNSHRCIIAKIWK